MKIKSFFGKTNNYFNYIKENKLLHTKTIIMESKYFLNNLINTTNFFIIIKKI